MRRLHAGCRCRCCCFYFAMFFFVVCACTCAINFWNLSANIFFVACTMHGANAKSWKLAVKHYFWYVNRAWHAIFLLFGHLFKFRNTWMTLATTLTSRFKFLMCRQWGQQLLSLLLLLVLSFNYSSRCCALNYATKYNANELGAAAQTHTNTHINSRSHTYTHTSLAHNQKYAHINAWHFIVCPAVVCVISARVCVCSHKRCKTAINASPRSLLVWVRVSLCMSSLLFVCECVIKCA